MQIQTRVVFSERMGCFYDALERRRLKGLAKLLAKHFWPTYRFARALRTAGTPGARGLSARQGRARGTRVDREVGRVVAGERVRGPLHPLTTFALSALERCRIEPVASQVVVYDGPVATAVDILGVHPDGTYAVVELKCSSDARYESACGPMRGPLAGRGDSLAQQHEVQALATRALFERTYGVRARAYVLRVNEAGATVTPLPHVAPDVDAAVEALCLSRRLTTAYRGVS